MLLRSNESEGPRGREVKVNTLTHETAQDRVRSSSTSVFRRGGISLFCPEKSLPPLALEARLLKRNQPVETRFEDPAYPRDEIMLATDHWEESPGGERGALHPAGMAISAIGNMGGTERRTITRDNLTLPQTVTQRGAWVASAYSTGARSRRRRDTWGRTPEPRHQHLWQGSASSRLSFITGEQELGRQTEPSQPYTWEPCLRHTLCDWSGETPRQVLALAQHPKPDDHPR
ncbi:hypothetical protein LENED_006932 [Lentinula edodes]|uniref:Uncharacterized protein n=1 Tax=Lentinula edodes TaxID=5353 RepID=A0A1Q3ED10_LENED|nr:hypothetical protein LENED_006932 [Lentinula edodes]